MIAEETMDALRENFTASLEKMNRSIHLGLNDHCSDTTTGKYLILQLFELHNSIGIELEDDTISLLNNTCLYMKICC